MTSSELPRGRTFLQRRFEVRLKGLTVRSWTHHDGCSRETYFWWPKHTLHLSWHRKVGK